MDQTLDWPTNDQFVSPDLKDFEDDEDDDEDDEPEQPQLINANEADHAPPKSTPQPPRAQKLMEESVISGQEHRAELIKKTEEERRTVEMTIKSLEEEAGRGR